MRFRKLGVTGVALLMCAAMVAGGQQARAASCAEADHPGGDWPSFGHDLSNSRAQPNGRVLSPQAALTLAPKWTFSVAGGQGTGNFQSTPTIANGCLYAGTSTGSIFAVNADTGELVWKTQLGSDPLFGLIGGVFALTAEDGRIYADVSSTSHPYAAALDAFTGQVLWTSDPVETYEGSYVNSSPVVYDGMLLYGISGPEGDPNYYGSFAIIDTATGDIIKKTYIIEPGDERGAGAGMWSTAVVDRETGYAYAGTSNPYSKKEHPRANAVVKIDLNRGSETFGEIVGSYHGDFEQYVPNSGLDETPVCEAANEGGDNIPCGQLDLDFGGSPNLIVDSEGRTLVGIEQKSGVYHAIYADSMKGAWRTIVGTPTYLGNASTGAFDGTSVYVAGSHAGSMFSLAADSGDYRWASPIADATHYQTVSTSNGVVYTVDTNGFFDAFDAKTGIPLLRRPMARDVGDGCTALSGGVAVARNMVYAVCDVGVRGGGWIVAYHPGGITGQLWRP